MNRVSFRNTLNRCKTVSLGRQFACFKTQRLIKSAHHFLPRAGFPVAFYLLCCLSSAGCTGQSQMAATATPGNTATTQTPPNTAAATAEPITWNQALRQKREWYASAEAVRIANNLLLYQRDNGGWNKNTDMAKVLTDEEKAELRSEAEKGAVSTIDNKSTFTQMEYLARVYKATGHEKYKESFLRGMDYLLEAQYENGGWPQFYPVREGYYEYITYNDGAMIGVMHLLRDVAQNKEPYKFVDDARRSQAATAIEKGLEVILKTQIEVDGKLTAWCAQHHHIDLSPKKARSFELVSISGGESVDILEYLMEIENPGPEVIRAVEGAVSWLERVKITGIRLDILKDDSMHKGYDVVVVKDPAAPPLLARFYEIGTNRPMFVGRDGIIREQLSEIAQERRSGYSWYRKFPEELVERDYPAWRQKWVATK